MAVRPGLFLTVQNIALSQWNKPYPFEGNPYHVQDNEELQFLCESIRENGVLSPLLVRKVGAAEEYEVISGHRRLYADTSWV